MECLTLEKQNRVATLTVDRPKVLNALNQQVFEELAACLSQLAADPEVGAVVVTGAGDKAFVAGADIKELAQMDPQTARALSARGQAVFRQIERFPKPVIAAVNGFALGGGCELALACHIRLAANSARFGLPEVKLGLIPGYGGTQRLARLVGKGRALELVLSGEMISAERAYEMGLVNHLAPPTELLEECQKLAGVILERGPLAVSHALEAVNAGMEMDQEDGERLESTLFGLLAATEDAREGCAAFIEKRPAKFQGR